MPTGEGLKVTLSAIPGKLTVDKTGRQILKEPMTFQIPPLEEYSVSHAYSFGSYDTIAEGQFMRQGSLQQPTWQFDTLAMYLDTDTSQHVTYPRWVPFPKAGGADGQKRDPTYYLGLLRALHNAGCPFRYVATLPGAQIIRRSWALLTAFSEVYKHGEGDAIYFTGLAFVEWQDPGGAASERNRARGYNSLPVHLRFRKLTGEAYIVGSGVSVPGKGPTTLSQIARYFYGDATKWRVVARANGLRGGDGNTPVWKRWFGARGAYRGGSALGNDERGATLTVPAPPSGEVQAGSGMFDGGVQGESGMSQQSTRTIKG